MCGITGLIGTDKFNLLQEMNDLLKYRGPDDSGFLLDKENRVGLGMRRLSIIDLESGKQPIANEDESLWVICNGEIYNSPQIRRELLTRGHTFRTRNSDVEVLLHLYEEKGEGLLSELNGMFAFVIYDKRRQKLFGARDRVGIKPFYYCVKPGKFAFASELKSLLCLPWVSRDINATSLSHYVSLQFIPAPDSIFNDIKKLPAGNFFVYDIAENNLKIKKYWELNVRRHENRDIEEWRTAVREKAREAVKRWTLSDVPIACSLSGGLDSSSLVAFLAESGVTDIRTYSLGFCSPEEKGCDELPLARLVAKKWGTKHHEVELSVNRVIDDLQKMVWHLDEPYAGGLPSWYIYELVGKDAKVCLSGTGGDELFGNYGKFRTYENLFYGYLKSKQYMGRASFIKGLTGRHSKGHYYHRYFSDSVKNDIVFGHKNPADRATEVLIQEAWNESGAKNPRDAVAFIDFRLQLPEEFLLVTDRFSMAHSVEARVPFLDHELVELVFTIPSKIRTNWRNPKYLLKQAVADLLPRELLSSPKKGFILPLDLWTRKQLRPAIESLLSRESLKRQGIFSSQVYERIVKPHLSGKVNLTQQVWTLFMFQMWYRKFVMQAG